MAQTPISASVEVLQNVVTTLYTVPVGKTAIVKGVVGGSVIGNNSATYTVNKLSSGTTYPITVASNPYRTPATGGTAIPSSNLLDAPITLAAGESITLYTGAANAIQFPNIANYTNTTGFTLTVFHLIYANSIFMAVGGDAIGTLFVMTSSDGITWTKQPTTSAFYTVTSVVFGNGVWVAVPQSGYDYTKLYISSDNGATWTKTSAIATGSVSCTALAYGNSTWVSAWADGTLFTATTPTTWTQNTAFATYTGGPTISYFNCIAWNGTYWFITGQRLGIVYSTDLTTYYSIGSIGFGTSGLVGANSGLSYSSAYSKFYAVLRGSSLTNSVFSSTDGISWTRNTVPAYSGGWGLEVAGSNTVLLIGNYTGNSSASGATAYYMKSTDGSTWATATDVRSYTGALIGLSNGYFIKFASNSSGATYYSTTDPTSLTGTLNAGAMTSFQNTNIGASNGTAWVAFGYNTSNNLIGVVGGTSGTNVNGVSYSASYDTGNYGYPCAATYNPTDGLYYMTTNTGYVFSIAGYNQTLTLIANYTGSGAVAPYSLHYFNNNLYHSTSNSSSSYWNYYWIGSSSSTSYLPAISQGGSNYNYACGSMPTQINLNYWSKKFASSSTKLVSINAYGFLNLFTTSSPLFASYGPNGAQHYQRLNNTDIFYGGVNSGGNSAYGIYQSSNAVTTAFTLSNLSYFFNASTDEYSYNHNSTLAYANSTYYAIDSGGGLWTGSTLISLVSTAVSSSAPNGESYATLSGATQLYTSGSDFYVLPNSLSINNNGRMILGYTNNIAGAVNNSIMTGSIVEIS